MDRCDSGDAFTGIVIKAKSKQELLLYLDGSNLKRNAKVGITKVSGWQGDVWL